HGVVAGRADGDGSEPAVSVAGDDGDAGVRTSFGVAELGLQPPERRGAVGGAQGVWQWSADQVRLGTCVTKMERGMPRTVAAFIMAGACSVLTLTISAQRRPTATLTPMDYVEIRQLVNRSAFAIDTGSNNGYDYADLFVEDGESVRPNARGRDQLAALARGGA